MRKLFLLVLTGFSLTAGRAQVMFGIKGGVNVTTITSNNYGELTWKPNVNAGVLASIPLFSHFSLQPEIFYSGQGTRSTEQGVKSNLNIDYISIPLLIKYQHSSGIFLESGPQYSKLRNAKFKLPNYNEDMKDFYRHSDFSWAFGLGYFIKTANVGFDLRYNAGITDIFNNDNTYNGSGRHSVFQASIFFIFSVKAKPAERQL